MQSLPTATAVPVEATNPFDFLSQQTQPQQSEPAMLPTYEQVISSESPSESPPAPVATPVVAIAAPVAAAPEAPLERLRKARMLLAEGLIEQNEFDEIKIAVLAQLKG